MPRRKHQREPRGPVTDTPRAVRWARSSSRLEEVARAQLEKSVDPARRDNFSVEYVCRDGYPSQTITQYAQEHGVDLIVMGTQGRGRTAQFVMGSVTQNVIRGADCPVLTVKSPPEKEAQS